MSNNSVLEIKDLYVRGWDAGRKRVARILRGVNLTVSTGECLFLIGESGCGKTTLLKILGAGTLPTSCHAEGQITWDQGKMLPSIAFINQSNKESLTPHLTVAEMFRISQIDYTGVGKNGTSNSEQFFGLLDDIDFSTYCRDLSGGEKTRLNAILAFKGKSSLIVADEPTTGLDTANKRLIIEAFLHYLQGEFSDPAIADCKTDLIRSCIIVTHDLDFVAELMSVKIIGGLKLKTAYMYGGEIMEVSEPSDPARPYSNHPYPRDLWFARSLQLEDIIKCNDAVNCHTHRTEGEIVGCVYQFRCSRLLSLNETEREACRLKKPSREVLLRCHYFREDPPVHRPLKANLYQSVICADAPILTLEKIRHRFGYTNNFRLNIDSLKIFPGDTVFIEGPSGIGKSTALKIITGLLRPASGFIRYGAGIQLPSVGFMQTLAQIRSFRRKVQYVFQETGLAYDPTMNALTIVSEPLRLLWPSLSAAKGYARVDALLEKLGILEEKRLLSAKRLSGGEIKRILLARGLIALGFDPLLNAVSGVPVGGGGIMAIDELTSGYDMINVHRVVALLEQARKQLDLTLIISSHDIDLDNKYPVLSKRFFTIEKNVESGESSLKEREAKPALEAVTI